MQVQGTDEMKKEDFYEDFNYIRKFYPLAICSPESTQAGSWHPGMQSSYVIHFSPHSKEIAGKGPSPTIAWRTAAAFLKEQKKNELPASDSAANFFPTVTLPSEEKVEQEITDRDRYEMWASNHWSCAKTSLWLKRDPMDPLKYIQKEVEAGWCAWQARPKFKMPKRKKSGSKTS